MCKSPCAPVRPLTVTTHSVPAPTGLQVTRKISALATACPPSLSNLRNAGFSPITTTLVLVCGVTLPNVPEASCASVGSSAHAARNRVAASAIPCCFFIMSLHLNDQCPKRGSAPMLYVKSSPNVRGGAGKIMFVPEPWKLRAPAAKLATEIPPFKYSLLSALFTKKARFQRPSAPLYPTRAFMSATGGMRHWVFLSAPDHCSAVYT